MKHILEEVVDFGPTAALFIWMGIIMFSFTYYKYNDPCDNGGQFSNVNWDGGAICSREDSDGITVYYPAE